MRMGVKIGLGAAAAVAVLAGVVVARTLTYPQPDAADLSGVRLAPAVAVDAPGAAARLSEAIRIPTVRHQDPAQDVPAEWDRLHAFLQASYPAAHAALRREVLPQKTLLYTWPGSDPSLAPIILMAHQDVVPVTPGAEADWKQPPFSGAIVGGAVWGRGALDDKGSLIGLFEATETLVRAGFKPRQTVILLSGGDEEVSGRGAQAAAALLKSRGVKPEFALDEGLVTLADNPITGGPLALIGTAEKGYATLRVTARAPGGHSSAPPADGGGIVALSQAVLAIADKPYPMEFRGPGADLLRALAPKAPFLVRMAVANEWLFGPLLVRQVGATPAGQALLHTTIAPTMLKGSPKENVLPQDATAWINYRIAPGGSSAEVMARAKAAVGDAPVTLAWEGRPGEPSPISSTSSRSWKILAALAGDVARAPAAPSLMTGASDGRWIQPVAEDVYRYQPVTLTMKDLEGLHGTNEHVSIANLERMIQFYARLIATAAG